MATYSDEIKVEARNLRGRTEGHRPTKEENRIRELIDSDRKLKLLESMGFSWEIFDKQTRPKNNKSRNKLDIGLIRTIIKLIPLKLGKDLEKLTGSGIIDALDDLVTAENIEKAQPILLALAPLAPTLGALFLPVGVVVGLGVWFIAERNIAEVPMILTTIGNIVIELLKFVQMGTAALGFFMNLDPAKVVDDAGKSVRDTLGLPEDPAVFVDNFERGVNDFIRLTQLVTIYGPVIGPVVYQIQLDLQKINADIARLEESKKDPLVVSGPRDLARVQAKIDKLILQKKTIVATGISGL